MILTALTLAITGRQLPPPQPKPLVGVRNLALSPDGSKIAFSYLGDVWVAPSRGGRALPVTSHVEMDDNPIWSPDGEWIAFSTNRAGSTDIYAVPAEGGQSRRITSFSNSEIPTDFSPDGKQILFRNLRDKEFNGIYSVDVNTGRLNELFLDPDLVGNARESADGKTILYTRLGFPWTRPRYQGSAAATLWRYDVATKTRTALHANGFQHLWPQLLPNGDVLTVTVEEKTPSTANVGVVLPKNVDNVRRTPNVYRISQDGKASRLTNLVGQPVRFLAVSRNGQTMAYENDGDVFVGPVGGQATKVGFTAVLDDKLTQSERIVLRDGAESSTWSSDGSTVVFTVRGELWSLKTKKGKGPNADDATQLTNWAGVDNQPLFTPDGKAVFFVSDREGGNRLYRLDLESGKAAAITADDNDVENLKLTPDKKCVSFWKVGKPGGIFTVPVAGGTPVKVLEISSSDSRDYAFSPDMKWLAYEEPLLRSGFYYWENAQNIKVLDLTSQATHDMTQLSAGHATPAWSADGKYLYCVSNREGDGIYAIPLKEEDARSAELDLKYEKPKAPVTVSIDFDGIEKRVRRLTSTPIANEILPDPENGDLLFLSGGDIWKTSYSGEGTTKVTNGGGFGTFEWSGDGKSLLGIRNGVPTKVDLRLPMSPVSQVAFRADWTHDLVKERLAAFDQFWRSYNRNFYDPNFHARDWAAIRPHYEKLLPSIGHRNEFATLLNEMVGELESSHSEVSPAPGNPRTIQTASLGVTFDYGYEGNGIKVLEVPAHSPGSFLRGRLSPGDVIEQINGKAASLTDDFLNVVLSDQVGRDVTLKVRGKDGTFRDVKLRAISNNESYAIQSENRFEARRQQVDQLSGGTIAYVHIAGMSEPELRRFNLQVWQRTPGKKGLIIDVRENGGGNTGDRIIDVLERLPNAYYAPRDESAVLGPGQALGLPIVVMCDESSFSNAEMFPSAMKARKLATLVGQPTPGYVIYTYGLPLIDGTSARMPQTGTWRLDGTPLENMGTMPDVVVDYPVELKLLNNDVQLAKAVAVLKK